MYAQVEKSKENKSRVMVDSVFHKKSVTMRSNGLMDSRPEAVAQRKLQVIANNSNHSHTIQRWPKIKTGSGNFTYELGEYFKQKHMASSKEEAMALARSSYDPYHKVGSHSAYVTVIYGDITAVSQGSDAKPAPGYHWALSIDVKAVCMGPKGRRGANGDPGQMDENISSIIVSGYGEGSDEKPAKITHVSTSN